MLLPAYTSGSHNSALLYELTLGIFANMRVQLQNLLKQTQELILSDKNIFYASLTFATQARNPTIKIQLYEQATTLTNKFLTSRKKGQTLQLILSDSLRQRKIFQMLELSNNTNLIIVISPDQANMNRLLAIPKKYQNTSKRR